MCPVRGREATSERREGGEGRGNDPPVKASYYPGELLGALRKRVEGSLGAYATTGLFVEGVLGEVGADGAYSRIYGVQLRDAEGTTLEVCLPRRLGERARGLQGRPVRVRGTWRPTSTAGGSPSGWGCAR